MQLGPLVEGAFEQRLNRFAATVELDGRPAMVHVANSGRMRELLRQGVRCLLAPKTSAGRKTAYDLALVEVASDRTVGEARREYGGAAPDASSSRPTPDCPRRCCGRPSKGGRLPPFADFVTGRREVVYGDSRLDLLLSGSIGTCLIEVKSVTLVEDGVGLFPDAPTERGRRHLGALVCAVREGYRAAVVFVVQRGGRPRVRPPRRRGTRPLAHAAGGSRLGALRPMPTSAGSRAGRYGWPMRCRCCSRAKQAGQ